MGQKCQVVTNKPQAYHIDCFKLEIDAKAIDETGKSASNFQSKSVRLF